RGARGAWADAGSRGTRARCRRANRGRQAYESESWNLVRLVHLAEGGRAARQVADSGPRCGSIVLAPGLAGKAGAGAATSASRGSDRAPSRVSRAAESLRASQILRIAAEIRALTSAGKSICN